MDEQKLESHIEENQTATSTDKNGDENVAGDINGAEPLDVPPDQPEITENEEIDDHRVIDREFGRNVFNVYLLLKYRAGLDGLELSSIKLIAYMVLLIEVVAMGFLTRMVMLQSGVSVSDHYTMEAWPFENSMLILPFFIITLVMFYDELNGVYLDWRMYTYALGDQKNYADDKACCCKVSNLNGALRIKSWEFFVMMYGAFGYLVVLALYANHDWEGRLDLILNMLAYQFILQLDEASMSFLESYVKGLLQHKGNGMDIDQLFQGKYTISSQEYTPDDNGMIRNTRAEAFSSVIGYSLVLQALYSRSWALLVLIIPVSCVASICSCFFAGCLSAPDLHGLTWKEHDDIVDDDTADDDSKKEEPAKEEAADEPVTDDAAVDEKEVGKDE